MLNIKLIVLTLLNCFLFKAIYRVAVQDLISIHLSQHESFIIFTTKYTDNISY